MKHDYKHTHKTRRNLMLTAAALALPALAAAVSATPEFFGFLGATDYQDEAHMPGWYKLSGKGDYSQVWADKSFGATSSYFTSGWLRNQRLCGGFGNRSQWFYLEFDPATGVMTGQRELDIEGENVLRYMYTAAYNPDDDHVYGFAYNADRTQDYFVRCPAWDMEAVEIIREMPRDYVLCASFCYNPTDQHFYGVDPYEWLIRVDTNGNFEALTDLYYDKPTDMANWSSGMTFSPVDNRFYWNAQLDDFESFLVSIDPADDYMCDVVTAYPMLDLYTFLCNEQDDREPGGADAPELLETTLGAGAATGTTLYRMPANAGTMTGLPSELTWEASVDRKVVKSGKTEPGARVEVEWELPEGEHTISMRVTGEGTKGASHWHNLWVGNDEPDRVRNIRSEFTEGGAKLQLDWEAVTRGTHGGFVDSSKVVYAVFLDDQQLLATKATEATIEVDPSWAMRRMRLMVVSVFDNQISEPAWTDWFTVGGSCPLPYQVAPTATDFEVMTTCNSFGGMSAWTMKADFGGVDKLFIPTTGDTYTDDWIFTPALMIENTAVKQEYSLRAGGNSNFKRDEYLEVWVGDAPSPDRMSIPVVERTRIEQINPVTLTGRADVPAAGQYYMGIRCTSSAYMSGLYVSDLSVTDTNEPSAVESVDSFSASLQGARGAVLAIGLGGETLEVRTPDGRLVVNRTLRSDREAIVLPAGLYVVSSGERSSKVAVR